MHPLFIPFQVFRSVTEIFLVSYPCLQEIVIKFSEVVTDSSQYLNEASDLLPSYITFLHHMEVGLGFCFLPVNDVRFRDTTELCH